MLFVVTITNYADRATISLVGADLQSELGLSPVQLGYIFSAFGWAYVLGQIPGGWLLDRFGSKVVYGAGLFLWSAFTFLQGFVGVLGAVRRPGRAAWSCVSWSVSPRRRPSRETRASSPPGSRPASAARPRRSSTRRSTSPRCCSLR